MVTKTGVLLERAETKTQCRHHWIIEPADGPTSLGTCKICGAEKQFDNVLEDTAIDKYDATAFARLSARLKDNSPKDDDKKTVLTRKKSAAALN